MDAGDVPEQVTYVALAAYLGRDRGVLLQEDYGEPYGRMGDALAVALAHPDAQTWQAEHAHSRGLEEGQAWKAANDAAKARRLFEAAAVSPPDTRIDPDVRIDAAYQRGFNAGRAVDVAAPVKSTLEDRLTPAYVIRRDAIFAAITHAHARSRVGSASEQFDVTSREQIMDAVSWWEARLIPGIYQPQTVPAGTESAHAVVFADQLIGSAGGLETVDSVQDSSTPGTFRVGLKDGTVLDVAVSEVLAPFGG